MKRARLVLVATWLAIGTSFASAPPAPVTASVPMSTVRGFFASLERHDFRHALALTGGSAAEVIARLLGEMDHEAARKHAIVELKTCSAGSGW